MSHKRNEALRHVQHSMHHVIAAGEGSDRAPDSCKLCPYYRPDFKFRTCLYAHCPYKKQVNVFRSTPEKWDILYTLNLRDSRVYDTIEEDGKEKRVLNQNETTLAQQKQQAIKDAFAGWVWKDPQRRALLVKKYNELFNSTRPREYDGSHIHFVGMNPEINLREHQRNAVAHVLYR